MWKREKNILYFVISLILIILLFTLTGCTTYENTDEELLSDKIYEELTYLENNIYNIAFKFANDDYMVNESDTGSENIVDRIQVYDFDKIRDDLKKVNNALDVALIDLSEKSIEKNEVMALSNKTNELYINLDEENVNIVLRDLNELEKVVIKNYESNYYFENNDSGDNNDLKLKRLKSEVLDAFILSQIYEEKELAKEKINNVIKNFENEIKNQEFVEENTYLVNNLYLNINELKNSIDSENDELIRLKYMEVVKSL